MPTVGEKRRRKKAQREMEDQFGLSGVPRKTPDGRKPRPTTAEGRTHTERDPRRTALEARCRQEGRGMTQEDRMAVSAQIRGSDVGRCLTHTLPDRGCKEAWDAWCGYTTAMRAYERRILGKSVHAKTANIEMEPDKIETDDHHTIDDRDEDQKDRDAVNGYMRWKGYLWETGGIASGLIEAARRSEEGLWEDAAPTKKGLAVAYALRDLSGVVQSR